MASTLKIPLLVELYRQVDRGLVDPDARIEVAEHHRVAGSGVLRHIGSGLRPTVKDLATLMIIVSDNVATDIVFEMVGRDNLNRAMEELGLSHTCIPMSTRELISSLVGVQADDTAESYQLVSDRLDQGEIDPDAGALSEDQSDVSTPDEMVRLLEMVYRDDILSPSSRTEVLDILGRQKLKTVLPYYLPAGTKVAHKTGGHSGVRCDAGIVFAPSGPYAVAIMAKDITDRTDLDPSLARVSRAIYDELGAGD